MIDRQTEKLTFHREKPVRVFNTSLTFYSMIKEINSTKGNNVAIEFFGTKITYAQLFKRVDRLASAYKKAGIKLGDCVALIMINIPAVQENLLALSKIGAISKWIDVRNKEKDLADKLNENECKVVVIFDGVAQNVINILRKTKIEKVIVVSPKDFLNPAIKFISIFKEKQDEEKRTNIHYDNQIIKYKDFINSGDLNNSDKAVEFKKDRPALIIQSSGSTGRSKSILHTEYNFNSEMQKEAYSDLPFADGKKMHVSVPPFIIYGLCNSVYAALAFSMTAVMTPFVRAEAIYDDLGKFEFACGAPFHFRYIYDKIIDLENSVKTMSLNTDDKKNLKVKKEELNDIIAKLDKVSAFICGGDKIAPQELLNMEHAFNTPIINGYGNNEMCGASIISPIYGIKPDSIGIPLKGVEVHAFNPDSNEQLPANEPGEICMRSDSMFIEYIDNPSETNNIKQTHSDGKSWIHTGDIGYIDDDGYVYITGRTKRLIKMDGFKIAPETIESAVLMLSAIKDCVVIGVPDKQRVEVPMIFLEKQSDTNVNDEELISIVKKHCLNSIPDYENPKYYEVLESIPYKNGKHDFNSLINYGIEYVNKIIDT